MPAHGSLPSSTAMPLARSGRQYYARKALFTASPVHAQSALYERAVNVTTQVRAPLTPMRCGALGVMSTKGALVAGLKGSPAKLRSLMNLNLEDLEAALSRSTPGEWLAYSAMCCPDMGGVKASGYRVCADSVGRYGHPMTIEDAEAVEAMHRAVPLLIAEVRRLREPPVARPLEEWDEARGSVLWWKLPICEPPWAGTPLDSDWPGYHTHWTEIVVPVEESSNA